MIATTEPLPRKALAGGAAGVFVGAVSAYALLRPVSSVVADEQRHVATASPEQLARVAGNRVYFGHQSVGRNLIHALPRVYTAAGMMPPVVVESEIAVGSRDPRFQHSNVGRNGDPLGKIATFDRVIRDGVGDAIDVAVVKLCYSDIRAGDDYVKVFETYRETLTALESDYPDAVFLHSTTPLTAEGDAVERANDRIKQIVGRGTRWPAPRHNSARERFNAMVRAEYADSGRLFDIAAIEATGRDGVQQLREHRGATYYALDRGLASDHGHLHADGAEFVASAFLAAIADAVS